ncbi:NAD-dependent epimerase/dehydratase family protein [Thermoactinospora rubra]|uniref:NAD-dependent epimerase/dehydratase family protein n=1 Tax=Thermoactinospora rubra TaxID=1088767 RepID=UPI000A11409F|nr:NAD(P)-dependent oxidoreductase [Thermoactinospora rubra]
MTTLVTGGRGFIGRHLVDLLVEEGERVVSYNRDFTVDDRPGVVAVQGELFDLPRLVRALTENSVDRIVHTAGMSHPGVSIDLPVTTFAANVDGTLGVFEAARMAQVRRIVNFSSECAYGNLDEGMVVGEDAKPEPTTPYGVTKVAGELLGKVYRDLYGVEVVSLRITEVYGPGLWMPSVLGDMLQSAVRGVPFRLDHGGDHPFQFVFARDVAAAARLASVARAPRQHVYNITGGSRVTLAQAADLIKALIPEADICLGGGHLPQWDRQGPFDISSADKDLDYRPQWSLEDGLRATVAWMRTRTAP